MIKSNHEVVQFVAELETTFKLPVESQVLKTRYENVSCFCSPSFFHSINAETVTNKLCFLHPPLFHKKNFFHTLLSFVKVRYE